MCRPSKKQRSGIAKPSSATRISTSSCATASCPTATCARRTSSVSGRPCRAWDGPCDVGRLCVSAQAVPRGGSKKEMAASGLRNKLQTSCPSPSCNITNTSQTLEPSTLPHMVKHTTTSSKAPWPAMMGHCLPSRVMMLRAA
eukprot:s41_g29.t1